MFSTFVFADNPTLLFFPPSSAPKLLFKAQGLLDTSSLPLSGREGRQSSWGQVFTAILPDKVGQALSSQTSELGLMSSYVNYFLPEWPQFFLE
jgi:hypothetical protein